MTTANHKKLAELEARVEAKEKLTPSEAKLLKTLRAERTAEQIEAAAVQIDAPVSAPAETNRELLNATIARVPGLVGSRYRLHEAYANSDFGDEDAYTLIPLDEYGTAEQTYKLKKLTYSTMQPAEAHYLAATSRLPQVLARLSEEEAKDFYAEAGELVKRNQRQIERVAEQEAAFDKQFEVGQDFIIP